ncbi:NaeI family type II restriction endonuclease [Paracoccaceae bacterium Fryx2]|nr:NaeI family type II restriction endonuclease [Paracoccaceae bacterium Fryx2]
MRRALPASAVVPGHPDFALLSALGLEVTRRAGGAVALAETIPQTLRDCVDAVIQTAKTGRRCYDDLEKTEKTYIGTRVEIDLRAALGLPKGRLDTVILGHDVDIKHTMGGNWMIPTEAIDAPCLLVAVDEARALCWLGLFVARRDHLTVGQNKDSKKSISAAGFAHILWLLRDQPCPPNFWRTVPPEAVARIFAGATGNARVMALFREVQRRPIGRDVIEAVARQQDFMRRIRGDGGRGTRDRLAAEGILLLSGHYDAPLIAALGLPDCGTSGFVSIRPETPDERALAHGALLP